MTNFLGRIQWLNLSVYGMTVILLWSCQTVKENDSTLLPLSALPTEEQVITLESTETSTTSQPQLSVSPSKKVSTSKKITKKRYALVIGNANYIGIRRIRKLENPVNDANDMAKTLHEVGFEVMLETDIPNREKMEAAVDRFTLQLEKGGIGLFYYAGHGIQADDGKNYLMPADFVLDKMEYARNDLNMIILDACRNNPLPTRGRGLSKNGLAEMSNPTGSILVYSTAPGTFAYDGDGRNGVFTKHLLQSIKNYAYMPIELMLKKVRVAVKQETHNEPVAQIP